MHSANTVPRTRHAFSVLMGRISTALAVVASLFLLAATLIISYMVLKRTFGLQSTWELEMAIELMVAAIFLGSPYTLATGGYVSMDLVAGFLGGRGRRFWLLCLRSVGIIVCLYMAWEGLRITTDAFVSGERALGVWQPLAWPKYATVPLGMFLTALQYLADMLDDRRASIGA